MSRTPVAVVAVVALLACTRQPAPPDAPAASTTLVDAGAPSSAWDVTRWGMSRAEARAALEKRGLVVTAHEPTKSPDAWLNTARGDWNHITVYFDEHDRLNQVVVIAEKTTAETIAKERTALGARFGASTQTRESFERRWDGPERAWFQANDHEGTYHVEEIYQSHATGPSVGMPVVSWGDSLEQTRARLQRGGFTLAAEAAKGNAADSADNMPNGPPVRVRTDVISFSDAEREGEAGVEDGRLTSIKAHPKARKTRAEAEQLEAAMVLRMKSKGEAQTSTETTWSDATTTATLEARQKAAGEYSAIIAYHQR